MIKILGYPIKWTLKVLNFLTPFGELAARLWIAEIFFRAGWLKIKSWHSTVLLFTHEFSVPLLSPYVAALLGTAAEIILPILLVLGLGGRISILIFFIYNAMAIISYPHLWTSEGAQGLAQHINWGLILALLMFHGPGKISLDYLITRKYGDRWNYYHNHN